MNLTFQFKKVNVELRDEEFASFGGNHATRFSLNMEGVKAFYATVVNSQALTSLISSNFFSFISFHLYYFFLKKRKGSSKCLTVIS